MGVWGRWWRPPPPPPSRDDEEEAEEKEAARGSSLLVVVPPLPLPLPKRLALLVLLMLLLLLLPPLIDVDAFLLPALALDPPLLLLKSVSATRLPWYFSSMKRSFASAATNLCSSNRRFAVGAGIILKIPLYRGLLNSVRVIVPFGLTQTSWAFQQSWCVYYTVVVFPMAAAGVQ